MACAHALYAEWAATAPQQMPARPIANVTL